MKKNSKGLLAAIASFAMVSALAFGPVAAYAQNYNVNIEKDQANVAVADRTFAAYKLFNATPEKDAQGVATGNYKYDYASDAAKTAAIDAYNALFDNDAAKLPADADASTVADKISKLTAEQAVAFAGKVDTTGLTTAATGKAPLSVEDGFYLITETTDATTVVKAAPFMVQVQGADKMVTLKSAQPDVDKIITDGKDKQKYNDYNIGDAVPFQISTKVPNTYGYDSYIFNINDEMSAGLTVTKAQLQALQIKFGDEPVTSGYTVYVVNGANETKVADLDDGWTAEGAKFKVVFDNKKFIGTYSNGTPVSYTQDPAAGTAITVDFNATLNEKAKVVTAEKNTTYINYSNKPGDNGSGESSKHEVYVYTFGIDLVKTFTGVEPTADDYAKVEFKMDGAKAGLKLVKISDGNYKVDPNGSIDPTQGGLKLNPTSHNIKIAGLDEGRYTFTEIVCPDGFQPEGTKVVTITAQYTGTGENNVAPTVKVTEDTQNNDGFADGKINNAPKTFKLPETGDLGFIIMPIVGLVIMLSAAGVAISSRMKKKHSVK